MQTNPSSNEEHILTEEDKDKLSLLKFHANLKLHGVPVVPTAEQILSESPIIRDLIEKVNNQDNGAARSLVSILALCLNQYCPHLPPDLIEYFSTVFGQIEDGINPSNALNIKYSRAFRQKTERFLEDNLWFYEVLEKRRKGITFEEMALESHGNNRSEEPTLCQNGIEYKQTICKKGGTGKRFRQLKRESRQKPSLQFPLRVKDTQP